MERENRISIIVPVYNAADYIGKTIESVQAQTYSDWELLLVDDCSADESCQIIRSYEEKDGRIRLIRQTKNAGAAMARNRGLSESCGRYIAFVDADDLWKPQKLEHELNYLKKIQEKEKKAGFVFSGYEFADEDGNGTGKIVRVPEVLRYRQALKNTTIFTSTVLFDTAVIPHKLIQMPQVKSEDTATWWQILKRGFDAYGLDENLVYYRRSAGTLSSDKVEAVRRIWNLYRKVEHLSLLDSAWNFCFYAVRAVLRRI